MANVQDFIQMAVGQLGITEQTAQGATGGLLNTLRDKVAGGDFQDLLGQVPGAQDVLETSQESAGEGGAGGGLLGGVMGAAATALGGSGGAALNLAGLLKGAGLQSGQIGSFVSLFLGFLKKNVGGDLVSRLLSKVPELQGGGD